MTDPQVLIAGGGPVGMTLALELARYGIRSLLLERNDSTTRHPKMDLTNGRSMELYARLGIVDALREVGVPAKNPFDISWITSLKGHEIYRFHYPSSNEAAARIQQLNDGTQAAQAPLRVSQIAIEPVLKRYVDANPLIDVRFGTAFEQIIRDNDDGIEVEISDSLSGKTEVVRGQFLAGCDGGGSRVRRSLGIELDGDLAVAGAYMVHFHSTDTDLLQRWGTTWHYQSGSGTLIAQNDKDTWTLQAWLPPGDDGSTWVAEDVLETWVGGKFNYKILQANPWSAHFVVAKEYVKGRAVLAGDSAHQYIPTGGYGMNSGIADAIGLAWVLSANIQGWGGRELLNAYESERKTTAWWHLRASQRHMGVRIAIGELYEKAGDITSCTAEAEKNRQWLHKEIAKQGNAENESWGVEMGYRYESNAIVADANSPMHDIDPLTYTPNTEPGCRLPHLFCQDGTSIHKKLGMHFTLLALADDDSAPIEAAAADLGIPLSVVRLAEPHIHAIYQTDYILIRPDQHIAWRGKNLSGIDWRDILHQVCGTN